MSAPLSNDEKRRLAVRSHAEVGALMGISAARVGQIEERALIKLRKYLHLQEQNGAASEGGGDEK